MVVWTILILTLTGCSLAGAGSRANDALSGKDAGKNGRVGAG